MEIEKLNEHETQTTIAQKLHRIYTKRLDTLRVLNDTYPLEKIDNLRGRIREVKTILNTLEPKPEFSKESDDTMDVE